MDKYQLDAIVNPANGLLVYNTDRQQFSYFDGENWLFLPTQTQISNTYVSFPHLNDTLNHYSLSADISDSLLNYVTNTALADSGYLTQADIPTQIWQQNTSGISYNNGFVGVGTTTPDKNLHIVTKNANSTIRLTNIISDKGTQPPPPNVISTWDITNNGSKLVFSSEATTIETTISSAGVITAQKFIGDGSQLTNLPYSEIIWEQNNDNIFYDAGNVRIGNHATGYSSYNQKLQIVSEGDVDAGMWTPKAHPLAIIGTETLLFIGTDQETECAYLQAYEFSSNKNDTTKQQMPIDII